MKLLLGDCLDKLKELDDNSVDSIVTDPPYGLAFMGKHWDYDVPSQQIWEECMRVLKPGGHILSFAGSRTYHRMAVRIEDAGFEIRDQIMWVYGSGFPKSHNIGKAVDKIEGNEREDIGLHERQNYKKGGAGFRQLGNDELKTDYRLSKGTSQWEGWGTALKPAHEPIVMARKPLSEKTVGNNVLEWGTGGINIDGCRVETDDNLGGGATNGSVLSVEGFDRPWMHDEKKMKEFSDKMKEKVEHAQTLGRFPANIIFDEEAGKLLDEQTGVLSNAGSPKKTDSSKTSIFGAGLPGKIYSDVGGASRFFYCPKTSKSDRNEGLDDFEKKVTMRDDGQPYGMNTNQFRPDGSERKPVEPKSNHHPTVKPTDLMAYLIRLVTPKGGIVLDPFMGSGSTGKAAVREGMEFIGIERENEYFEIAKSRIEYETNKPTSKTSKTKKVEVETKVEEKVNQFFG